MDTAEGILRDGLYIKSKPSPYSPPQLARYITRIGYTPIIANGLFAANLDNLERLIRLHLLAFPFENTAMHYTLERTVNLEPQSLYHRFMDELKGADCFGQNSFFLYILRGLGYRAYNVVGRVNIYKVLEPTEYPPQDHLLMLVQPIPDSNVTYLVDVGYCTGPIRPILLTDSDKSIVLGTTDTERYRIKRRADPRSSVETRGCSNSTVHLDWVLEIQHVNGHTPDTLSAPWIPMFTFSEAEFYENDIYNASFSLCFSRSPIHGKMFRHNVIAMKCFLLDSERTLILDADKAGAELAARDVLTREFGRAILVGQKLKFTRGGESEIRVVESENERIRILKELFGIVI
ncbi:hypothetical protein JOM56_005526 [Amanita muscaria]